MPQQSAGLLMYRKLHDELEFFLVHPGGPFWAKKIDGAFDDYEALDRDDYKAWDYGLSAGVGINVGAAQIGARYNYGLQKIAGSDSADLALGDSKNSNAQVYVSFNFN